MNPFCALKSRARAEIRPADNAVEPEGVASRSTTTASAPASFAASAAQRPAAPAPMMRSGTFVPRSRHLSQLPYSWLRRCSLFWRRVGLGGYFVCVALSTQNLEPPAANSVIPEGSDLQIMSMRFRDWIELDTTERAELSANSGEFARKLEPRLKAFVEFESGAVYARGVLRDALCGQGHFVSASPLAAWRACSATALGAVSAGNGA